jgi:hypothetical protein
MNFNIQPKWLSRMAEKEDNGIISAGGLPVRLRAAARFAARSAPTRSLTADEVEALEEFVNALDN